MACTMLYGLSKFWCNFKLFGTKKSTGAYDLHLLSRTMPTHAPTDQSRYHPTESLDERASKIRRTALLPSTSGPRYEEAWTKFMEWKATVAEATSEPTQEMLLVYLDHLSDRFASSSLWTIYSMLKKQMLVILSIYLLLFSSFRYCTRSLPSPLLTPISSSSVRCTSQTKLLSCRQRAFRHFLHEN
jgi:hypothetical protein